MTKTVRGACYCGAVRFEADLPAYEVGHCHCDNCRRAQGAAFLTFAIFPDEQFRVVGGEDELRRYVDAGGSTRGFCRVCGSTFIYASPRWPGTTVAVANLLDPLDQPATRHYYADRAPEWGPIHDDLPRFGGESGEEPLPPE